ncbi:MAG: hypothetical protein M3Z26_00500 [Bacteroidota bacterium]|nr:hypothetical protein [Bacteroidota bacterium]
MITKKEPFNWSNYEKTYNHAIDLTAQAIGYHRKTNKPLKAIILKPTSYDLFKAGLKVLSKAEIDPTTELYFDGVLIKRGGRGMFDSITFEYYQ